MARTRGPTIMERCGRLSPAAVAPFLQVRALRAEGGVLTVAGVHPGAIRQRAEHPFLKVIHELVEPLGVSGGVARTVREQVVTCEQVRCLRERAATVIAKRDASWGVAAQMDDTEDRLTDGDGVAAIEQFRQRHREFPG